MKNISLNRFEVMRKKLFIASLAFAISIIGRAQTYQKTD
jgi:hypothetical protein